MNLLQFRVNLFTEEGKNVNFPDTLSARFDIEDRIYILRKFMERAFWMGSYCALPRSRYLRMLRNSCDAYWRNWNGEAAFCGEIP